MDIISYLDIKAGDIIHRVLLDGEDINKDHCLLFISNLCGLYMNGGSITKYEMGLNPDDWEFVIKTPYKPIYIQDGEGGIKWKIDGDGGKLITNNSVVRRAIDLPHGTMFKTCNMDKCERISNGILVHDKDKRTFLSDDFISKAKSFNSVVLLDGEKKKETTNAIGDNQELINMVRNCPICSEKLLEIQL